MSELSFCKIPAKVFLVMDNLKVHHCKPVKEWLEEHKNRIEVFYLPSYSPELNPDERSEAHTSGLHKKTQEHMTMVKATPERVKTYFKDEHVRYAAESM